MDKYTIRERIIVTHKYLMFTIYGVAILFFVLHVVFLLLGDDPGDGGRPVDTTPTPDQPWSIPREWIREYAERT